MPRRETPARPPLRELKIVQIGNSHGVRLPRELLAKYLMRDAVILEERKDGVLLRSTGSPRLSWEETYKEMARDREDFADLDVALADGLHREPW